MSALYASLNSYVRKHRRAIAITAGIIGGAYLLGHYARTKLAEAQEHENAKRVARENLRRRFEQNQQDCTFTVLSLLPTLSEQLLHELNVEAIWNKLQQSRKTERVASSPIPSPSTSSSPTEATKLEGDSKRDEDSIGSGESSPKERSQAQDDLSASGASLGSVSTSSDDSAGAAMSGSMSESMIVVNVVDPASAAGALDKKTKYQLWEELKVVSFTRTLTSLYLLVILTLLTHIQLNLLGRFTYISSVAALNRDEPTIRLEKATPAAGSGSASRSRGTLDFETERRFLGFSWWILNKGWRRVAERVEGVVKLVMGTLPLKQQTTYADITALVDRIRTGVEYDTAEAGSEGCVFNFRPVMLPDSTAEECDVLAQAGFLDASPVEVRVETEMQVEAEVRRLLDETRDFIDSQDFQMVLHSCLDEVFTLFLHNTFARTYNPLDTEGARDREERERTVPLANLLPAVSRQAHMVVNGVPNEYVETLAYIKELQGFSAIIYSSFDEAVAAA